LFSEQKKSRNISRPIVKIAVGGIALGIAVMILSLSIVTGFQNEIKNKVIGIGSHINIIKLDNNVSLEPQPIAKNQPFLNSLKNNSNIKHTQVFAIKNGIVKTKTENEGIVLKGIDEDYDLQYLKNNLVDGSVFQVNQDTTSNSILISKYLSNKLGLKIGEKVLVYFVTKKKAAEDDESSEYEQRVRNFTISGIYDTGFEDVDAQLAFVDIKHLQKINYWETNQVGGFEIQLNDFSKVDAETEMINELIGYELNAQNIKQIYPGIFGWLELMDSNAVIIISLMLIVASINMISALLILMLEKTSSIGLLKALGAGNHDVRKIFLNLSFKLITKGLIIGNLIGISLSLIQLKFKLFTLMKETYYLEFVPINFDLIHILLLNIGTLICCMLFMLLPTLVINKISPIKAIRFS
jgi:lipoprotein-releasing system permease protein